MERNKVKQGVMIITYAALVLLFPYLRKLRRRQEALAAARPGPQS